MIDKLDVEEKQTEQSEPGQLNFLNEKNNEIVKEKKKDLILEKDSIQEKKSDNFYEPENAPKNILILDTETTGLDKESNQCIEVGSVLFNVQTRSVLAQQSFLLPVEKNEAEKINNIPAEITRISQPLDQAIKYFVSLVQYSDLIIAHNVEFDKKWFGINKLPEINKQWVCTMDDISWPSDRNLKTRPSVTALALAYGIPVWSQHRALTDCIYLAEVFKRCDDLENLLTRAQEPKFLIRADISYEERHLAKKAGFRWNDEIERAWSRRMSRREMKKLEFQVREIDSIN